jgi:serine/threonine protein phosphatase PrpC
VIEASDHVAVLLGRDHPHLGAYAIEGFGEGLAVGLTAGARARQKSAHDPNEDVGVVVHGRRARLLAVADSHFGREAAEAAVAHVLAALGDDPPPADLSADELVEIVHGAGVAIERTTTPAGARSPHSRTTLAFAIVAGAEVQWASIGDSSVILATGAEARRVNTPRRVFLGSPLTTTGDIAGALSHGLEALPEDGCVVLASDGLTHALDDELVPAVASSVRDSRVAGHIAHGLLERALDRGVSDAVVVAVAVG